MSRSDGCCCFGGVHLPAKASVAAYFAGCRERVDSYTVLLKRTPQELSALREIIVIVLNPIHQTIIILTNRVPRNCLQAIRSYDFSLDGVSSSFMSI